MNKISIVNKFLFALSIVFLISCDTDYNEIGADIIDGDMHHNMLRYEANVIARDKATGAVQTNNLPLNSLGIYNNPAFGKTTAHFVTQLQLASENPTFGANVVIDTVYLYVPYFSKLTSTDSNGNSEYTLDSIHGNPDAKMKLKVYENRFFLRDADPGAAFITGQKYFSSDKPLIDGQQGQQLNDATDNRPENEEFVFSPAEIRRTDNAGVVKERLTPGIFLNLNKQFFQNKIVNAAAGKLVNNNVFKDYFRGIYFNVEQIGDQAAMAVPRFDLGKIVMIYHEDGPGTSPVRVRKTLTINMKGNTINLLENEYKPAFTSAVASSDNVFGDDRLYVKGGEGSMAFIDILSEADINFFRQNRILINEANLTFYIDNDPATGMGQISNRKENEPLRVYLYDINNKRPVYDFYTDGSTNSANPKYAKSVHGGIIQRSGDQGIGYKIRITNHINNIINKDSTNVKLGLVVTESINIVSNAALKNAVETGSGPVKFTPAGSVINPFGTILFGNNIPVGDPNYDKRLKLEIYYTKPN
jgi:hypothetical protein